MCIVHSVAVHGDVHETLKLETEIFTSLDKTWDVGLNSQHNMIEFWDETETSGILPIP